MLIFLLSIECGNLKLLGCLLESHIHVVLCFLPCSQQKPRNSMKAIHPGKFSECFAQNIEHGSSTTRSTMLLYSCFMLHASNRRLSCSESFTWPPCYLLISLLSTSHLQPCTPLTPLPPSGVCGDWPLSRSSVDAIFDTFLLGEDDAESSVQL